MKPGLLAQISAGARRAAGAGDWARVDAGARRILSLDADNPEGWFLAGLAHKAGGRLPRAAEAFARAIARDPERYDAGIELAWVSWRLLRHREARELLERYQERLANSPLYLHLAGETWTRLGLHARAWPLYLKASELQPEADKFRASLAACAVLLGKVPEAKALYLELLRKHPSHQRNHYELARLGRADDDAHIRQMLEVLDGSKLPPEKNIFLFFGIAKELEDLGRWDESFEYLKKGNDAAAAGARAAGYEVGDDVALIDKIIEVCDGDWLATGTAPANPSSPVPIFVVGLPRTGTTLTERIIASHSRVESADETFFMQLAVRRATGVRSGAEMSPEIVAAAARKDPAGIACDYLDSVAYRLSGKPLFVDKYPFNYLYLGFVARGFPDARIVHLRRNPMDACFAMYKQSYFKFAYTLEDLARYYPAYERLSRHWREHLGGRLVEVGYERLVADPEGQIRALLERLGLEFEPECLEPHLNLAPSATASAVQVRERIHTRSVARWKRFERHLEPLKQRLQAAGIEIG